MDLGEEGTSGGDRGSLLWFKGFSNQVTHHISQAVRVLNIVGEHGNRVRGRPFRQLANDGHLEQQP